MLRLLLVLATTVPAAAASVTCLVDVGVDHAYGDLKIDKSAATPAKCCAACQSAKGCVAWVLETDNTTASGWCFLKAKTSATPCSKAPSNSPCTRKMATRVSMAQCPNPPPPPPHWLPVAQLSARFRNWSYYTGSYDGFVVPPLAGNFSGQSVTDTAVVFEKAAEDTLPGRYRMTYLWFNETKDGNGYEVGLALSDDLLNWTFGRGGDAGLVFKRNPTPGTYDYGGVTLGGMLYTNSSLRAPRKLKKVGGKYWALYGCYPSRAGYESGDGGQGMASSEDGVVWQRVSPTVPTLPGASKANPPWRYWTCCLYAAYALLPAPVLAAGCCCCCCPAAMCADVTAVCAARAWCTSPTWSSPTAATGTSTTPRA